MTTIQLYNQLVPCGNSIEFKNIEDGVSLFIKNIALFPTKERDSYAQLYIYENDKKIMLYRLDEQTNPNQVCMMMLIEKGKSKQLFIEGKGQVQLIGYLV
ncbi:hypothetical protein EDI_281670 [Entamoeba dispar SAW760]|uniref:Nucleoplasmin-like domain-containing protein n=1 Tax=Entamoeba dispar (strain ATCC PRA-260 / SAW760) TaxID=370354 RepID=B0EP61_ENTDS|nr:uncharacterized protein EDI_281670 [Entamoeba dispar SAW760]EDR23691.1 hypothetical protein EDI_281670 [Entamoeba dispar SAW760]|eukprot:EDR23691.1 hypothetical protein EDI_281670 [Entamoeba dispar SAW760]